MTDMNSVSESNHEITHLLSSVRSGNDSARNRLFERVYDELHVMARRRMRSQSPGQTLQTTELVHEAYLKLCANKRLQMENRRHFFGAAVSAMRQILVEQARQRGAEKRGAGSVKVTLDHRIADREPAWDLLALDRALDKLARSHPRHAKIVGQRYFLGLTIREIAEILEISPRTVNLDWSFAKAWLKRELTESERAAARAPLTTASAPAAPAVA